MLRCAAATLFTLGSLLTACGSSDHSGAGGGGSSAAGSSGAGTSGASSGGSSGTAGSGTAGSGTAGGSGGGNTVRGAISVNVQTGSGCAVSTQTQDYPAVSAGHPVNATAKGDGIANQQLDASGVPAMVHCTWFSDAAPYMIDAGVGVSQGGSRRTASLAVSLTNGSTATGQMSFDSKDLPSADGYTATCTFSVIQLDPTTRSVWGSFSCDSLSDFTNPTGCTVAPSYFFFDNCKKP